MLCTLSDLHLMAPFLSIGIVLMTLCQMVTSEASVLLVEWQRDLRVSSSASGSRFLEEVNVFYLMWPLALWSLILRSSWVWDIAIPSMESRQGCASPSQEIWDWWLQWECLLVCPVNKGGEGVKIITKDQSVQGVIHSCPLTFAEAVPLWTENQDCLVATRANLLGWRLLQVVHPET